MNITSFFNVYAVYGHEKISRDAQSLAAKYSIFDGSSGNDWRLLQCSTIRDLSWESWLRPAGIVMKLFLLRFKYSNGGRELTSLGINPSNRMQSLKFNVFKEYKPNREGSRKHSVGDGWKEKTKFLSLDSTTLHPANDNTSRFFRSDGRRQFLQFWATRESKSPKRCQLTNVCRRLASFLQLFRSNKTSPFRCPTDEGNSLLEVPSRTSSLRPSIFSGISGSFLSLMQFERIRVLRDFNLKMLLGNDLRLLHSLRLNKTNPVRFPMEEGNPFIAVPSKESSGRCSIFPLTSGNCLSFEQPESRNLKRLHTDAPWETLKLLAAF